MDKEYILFTLRERIKELKRRYGLINHGKDEHGRVIETSENALRVRRHNIKRDLNLCKLIEELVVNNTKVLTLSDDALVGLESIMEPMERHRRLRDQVS